MLASDGAATHAQFDEEVANNVIVCTKADADEPSDTQPKINRSKSKQLFKINTTQFQCAALRGQALDDHSSTGVQ